MVNFMESEAAQWRQIYRRLKSEGKLCAPRGLQILEVENFSYSLAPYVRFPNFEARHLNLDYIREEFQWYLGGDPYDLGILQHASIWRNLVLRGRLNSNYGLYVFRKGGLDWAASELARDRDSRRACITILDDTHLKEETLDVPCTAYMNFRIRNNKLNMSVHMRSQDAIYGMTNDAPAFSFVHEMLYVALRDTCYPDLQMGDYHHTADSFHVYARHFKMLDELCKDGAEFTTIEVPRISGAQEVDYLRSCSWMTDVPPREFDFTHWLTDAKLQIRSEIGLSAETQKEKGVTVEFEEDGDS